MGSNVCVQNPTLSWDDGAGHTSGFFSCAWRGTVQQMKIDTTIELLEEGMASGDRQRWPIQGR